MSVKRAVKKFVRSVGSKGSEVAPIIKNQKPINQLQAIKIAIRALEYKRQKIAFDANIHKNFGYISPCAMNAAKEYDEINQAIEILEEMKNDFGTD